MPGRWATEGLSLSSLASSPPAYYFSLNWRWHTPTLRLEDTRQEVSRPETAMAQKCSVSYDKDPNWRQKFTHVKILKCSFCVKNLTIISHSLNELFSSQMCTKKQDDGKLAWIGGYLRQKWVITPNRKANLVFILTSTIDWIQFLCQNHH